MLLTIEYAYILNIYTYSLVLFNIFLFLNIANRMFGELEIFSWVALLDKMWYFNILGKD